ncbi:MAG: hypothetical protein HC773_04500 [Scytonema sp. CRU_2_7]|nr:hypothetical protein [Scytonema sp. CRU_2_7]
MGGFPTLLCSSWKDSKTSHCCSPCLPPPLCGVRTGSRAGDCCAWFHRLQELAPYGAPPRLTAIAACPEDIPKELSAGYGKLLRF